MKENILKIEQYTTSVNLQGLMQVVSKNLYSTPIVALRELVQNAHDAIIRRKLEQKNTSFKSEIRVIANPQEKTISICDTGSGLTKQEIHDFLATVGIGYTRLLRQKDDNTGLIGMFGLGFLSAFVLAEQVTVLTTSWKTPDEGWLYRSKNGETYKIGPVDPIAPGLTVTLHLRKTFDYLSDSTMLENLLGRYCVLLREPLFVGRSEVAVNHLSPPWRSDFPEVTLHPGLIQKRNIEFASRFERSFTPICTINVAPYGKSDVVGILWIQDGATYGTSDNRNLSLFLRGMLLDDQAHDLLPLWAGFVGGVVESNCLTPTANREDLQRDDAYYATQHALSEALIKGLGELAKNQPTIWRRVLRRHNEAMMGAAICDERLFHLLKDDLLIPTSQGEIPARALRKQNSLLVMPSEESSFEEILFRLTGRPIAFGHRYAVIPFLRRWATLYSAKLIEVGTTSGNESLFLEYEISQEEEKWWADNICDNEECIISRFEPSILPFIVVPNRDVELKNRLERDDADRKMSTAALILARKFTQRICDRSEQQLYINFNNQIIKKISERWRRKECVNDAIQLLKVIKVILSSQFKNSGGIALQKALDNLSDLMNTQFFSDKGN